MLRLQYWVVHQGKAVNQLWHLFLSQWQQVITLTQTTRTKTGSSSITPTSALRAWLHGGRYLPTWKQQNSFPWKGILNRAEFFVQHHGFLLTYSFERVSRKFMEPTNMVTMVIVSGFSSITSDDQWNKDNCFCCVGHEWLSCSLEYHEPIWCFYKTSNFPKFIRTKGEKQPSSNFETVT